MYRSQQFTKHFSLLFQLVTLQNVGSERVVPWTEGVHYRGLWSNGQGPDREAALQRTRHRRDIRTGAKQAREDSGDSY